MNKYSLYENNNIIPSLSNLTNYPINEMKNQVTSLYYSTFIGYDKECLSKNGINIFEEKDYGTKMKIIDVLYTILFYIFYVGLAGIFLLSILLLLSDEYKCKEFTSLVCLLIQIYEAITFILLTTCYALLMQINYENNCTDSITTLIYAYYSKSKRKMSFLILLIMVFQWAPLASAGIYFITSKLRGSDEEREKRKKEDAEQKDLEYLNADNI